MSFWIFDERDFVFTFEDPPQMLANILLFAREWTGDALRIEVVNQRFLFDRPVFSRQVFPPGTPEIDDYAAP